MIANHALSLSLYTNPRCIDPCVSRNWIAAPLTKTVIGLWRLPGDVSSSISNASSYSSSTSSVTKPFPNSIQPVELNGHLKEIKALAFSYSHTRYLVSACKDMVLRWDLRGENGEQINSERLFSKPGDVTAICICNSDDNLIAVGVDYKILLLKNDRVVPLAVLDAHRGMITRLEFCYHYSATLISLSDDRSFCVWDVRGMLLLHQSKIISSTPLISMSMSWTNPHVAIGSADGRLKVFDLTDNNDFRQLADINIAIGVKKYFYRTSGCNNSKITNSLIVDSKNKETKLFLKSGDGPSQVEFSESILSVVYVYCAPEPFVCSSYTNTSSGVGDVLERKSAPICIITTNALLQIDSRTFDIVDIINLQMPINSNYFSSSKTIGSIAYAGLGQMHSSLMLAVVGTLFDNKSEVILWNLKSNGTEIISNLLNEEGVPSATRATEDVLSVIPNSTIMNASPLMSKMLLPPILKFISKSDVATGKAKSISIMNQPLTFQKKIRSSGYSQASRTTMFKPVINSTKSVDTRVQKMSTSQQSKVSASRILKAEYDTKRGPPTEHCDTFKVDNQDTAVFTARFSDNGSVLGCALANKCAFALRFPFSKQISISYVGHNNLVNTVYWSHDNSYLLTSSCDKTAALWDSGSGDTLMKLTHQKHTCKEMERMKDNCISSQNVGTSKRTSSSLGPLTFSHASLSNHDNQPFTKSIKHAQFFYIDTFILLTHGSELALYSYNITHEQDDIKRYQSQSRYKLVSTWQTVNSSFTATTAVNSFYSHLVMCTTSGCNLEVYDLNKSVLAHTFTDCHTRPAHCITMNEGSCFTCQLPEAHNVVATIARSNPIKLWDLRSKSSIHSLQGHLNNVHECQIAFSPCGNYLASGSEDKSVFIFDLRVGTYCNRLRGHTETVLSVAYDPASPLLATGGLNGNILFFKSK